MALTAYKLDTAGEPSASIGLVRNPAQRSILVEAPVVRMKKRTLLPVLTVLFLISYGLMTMLIVEQGNTIQSQRYLIQQLFSDSVELSSMKGKAAMQHAHPELAAPPTTASPKLPANTLPKSEETSPEHKKLAIPRVGPKVSSDDARDLRRMLLIS
jgi:hypothetical protein